MSKTCQKVYSLTVAGGPAPCSLFIPDNTVFATVTVNGTCPIEIDAPVCSVLGLPIGAYQWFYISGAYFVANFPDTAWVSHAGGCNGLGKSMGDRFVTKGINVPGGFNYNDFPDPGFDFPTIAAAEAFWPFYNPINGGFNIEDNGQFYIKTCQTTDPFAPVFELRRMLQLIAPQPLTLQIDSYATFANGRFKLTYGGFSTSNLTFTALAATVQAALNLLPSIIADGGVTCAGTLTAGMTITWNLNGARAAIVPSIPTISPGMRSAIVVSIPGNPGLQEVQTLTVDKFCGPCNASVLPEWNGLIDKRWLNGPVWRTQDAPIPLASPFTLTGILINSCNGFGLQEAWCFLSPFTVPCSWILAIMCDGAGPVWVGQKTTGNTPEGTYVATAAAIPGLPPSVCGHDPTGCTPQITLTGTF